MRSVTNMGICLILSRVLEMKREGFVRRSWRRALNEFVRFSISTAGRLAAAGVFGKITEERRDNDRRELDETITERRESTHPLREADTYCVCQLSL